MFSRLVIMDKLIDYEYFMDRLSGYEMQLLLDNIEAANKTDWETARWICYCNALFSGNMKKSDQAKSMIDLFPIACDKFIEEHFGIHNRDISNEQVDILRERGKRMSEYLKNKNKK